MLLAALIIAAAVAWGAVQIARELKAARDEAASGRALALVQLFAPALAAAQNDPRSMLVWQPLARTVRQMFPAEFGLIERATGSAFPFTPEQLQAAHARWTTEWLAWERTHDAEYKLRAATLEHELTSSHQSPLARAKLEAVEREKLDLYQKHYEEYVRVSKALQSLS